MSGKTVTESDIDFSTLDAAKWWSGYQPANIAALMASAVEYDGRAFTAAAAPERFSIADWYDVEQQGPVGRCAGEAGVATAEVEFYKATGREIQFNGHATYIWAQNRTPWRGSDNGTSIESVVESLETEGACPIDWDNDGRPDYPKPPRYTRDIPAQAKTYAARFKFESHAVLRSFDDIVSYSQTQGTVFIGGDWGNWRPDASGLVTNFRPGGGGHAWCIPGFDRTRTRFNEDVLEGVNSHGLGWGIKGFHWMNRRFVDAFLRHQNTVCVGMSQLTTPGPTKYDFDKWRKAIRT